MKNRDSRPGGDGAAPLRVLGIVLVLVFGVEVGIMLTMPAWSPWPLGDLALSVMDASLLTAVLSPALWYLIVRPIRNLSVQRGRLLARIIEVQESERARISRDLHDDLGQLLTAVKIGLRTITDADTIDQARERAQRAGATAAEALDVVRRMARGLRTGVLEDLGLRAALERLVEDVSEGSGIEIAADFKIAKESRLPHAVEIGAYRLAQEALTNVIKHADARNVTITVRARDDGVDIAVRDDGRGFSIREAEGAGTTLGLQGMRERVAMLGGTMRIESSPGHGTSILIRLPSGDTASDETNPSHDR